MSSYGRTPESKKTRFGTVPDFNRAQNELSETSLGELVNDITEYQEDNYDTAQEIARAFHDDDPEKYNKNQMTVRETAKENVDNHNQPEWSWDLLSVYSEDLGKKLLDVPSGGSNKGLIIDEDYENAFLYSKKADGISAVEHVNRWYDNGVNAQSIGYELPSQEMERIALDVEGEDIPVLKMRYNSDMVLDTQIDEFLEKEFGENSEEQKNRVQDIDDWVKDSSPNRSQKLEEKGVENIKEWMVGLELLTEHDLFVNYGVEEYTYGQDNSAMDPGSLKRLIVDVGEYREDDSNTKEFSSEDGLNKPMSTKTTSSAHEIAPNRKGASRNKY